MGLFGKKKIEERSEENSIELGDLLLSIIMSDGAVSLKQAMNVPTFAGCVNRICETISVIPFYLYKRSGDSVELLNDRRAYLINEDTGDTLSGADFKKALVFDYLTSRGGYAFINKNGLEVKSIHYVDSSQISFQYSEDPIFKNYKINCGGKTYYDYQFIKVLRRTKNGFIGTSVIDENNRILNTAFRSLLFELMLVSKGGNKRGFLESEKALTQEALDKLRESFNKLYRDQNENVVVLNNGIKFKESSETSTEMQLNENKRTNAVEICKIFGMPPSILSGNATEQDKLLYVQYCIVPILETICKSFNRDLLLETEKKDHFFAADIKELVKGDLKARFDAYSTALKAGFMQTDEIRERENMPSLDIPYVKMGLQDALYNPETGAVFTLNTGKGCNIKDAMDGKVNFNAEGVPDGQPAETKPTSDEADTDNVDKKEEEEDESKDKS